jgi:hypothetical protein
LLKRFVEGGVPSAFGTTRLLKRFVGGGVPFGDWRRDVRVASDFSTVAGGAGLRGIDRKV